MRLMRALSFMTIVLPPLGGFVRLRTEDFAPSFKTHDRKTSGFAQDRSGSIARHPDDIPLDRKSETCAGGAETVGSRHRVLRVGNDELAEITQIWT
jgi:hypothetical protein